MELKQIGYKGMDRFLNILIVYRCAAAINNQNV
jgi:hypothetical protein